MSFEITGILKKDLGVEEINEKFSKRTFVLGFNDGKYVQMLGFELHNAKTDLLDGVVLGSEITVTFDLRGREWNDKFFTNLVAWKIEANEGAPVGGGTGGGDPF